MTPSIPLISVCIITYKRNENLTILLESIAQQTILAHRPVEIVVVDNHSTGFAKSVVDDFSRQYPNLWLIYEIEPEQGIPLARNHSVRLASGEYIAFVDDDEKTDKAWLEALYECIEKHEVDAVFGRVEPLFPPNTPDWIIKGRFFNRPYHKDGTPASVGRTNNALVRRRKLDQFDPPFDPSLRYTGGSDSDLFSRMFRQGGKFCWAEHAVVYEFVGRERLKLKWLVMRAFRGGQGHAWQYAKNRPLSGKIIHLIYRAALCFASILMVPLFLLFGRHKSVWWLRKFFSNLGQIAAFLPYKYEEYKQPDYR